MFREKTNTRCRKPILMLPALMAGGLCAFAAASGTAEASDVTKIKLCNEHNERLYLSVAYEPEAGKPLMARGWWNIDPNKCTELELPVASDRLLVHGQSASEIYQWIGDKKLCVDEKDKFDLDNSEAMACDTGTLGKRGFKEVSISSLIGTEPGAVARYDFKAADAQKVGKLVRVCNDTQTDAYIALAQKNPIETKHRVNGWYSIKPQSCYETLRAKGSNELFLYANSEKDKLLWRGDTALCVDDVDGFNFDDGLSMACDQNNQRQYLFRKIAMTDTQDFEYRLRAEDAQQTRSLVDLCNVSSEPIFLATLVQDRLIPGQNISAGWYNIEAGKCVENVAVDADNIKLHVEDELRDVLLEGETQACINYVDGFEFAKATTMNCTAPDLELVKFATKMLPTGKSRIDLP